MGRTRDNDNFRNQDERGWNSERRPHHFERYDRVNREARNERIHRGDENRPYQNRDESQEGKGYFGKGPKGWKRSPERLKEEVSEALYMSPRIDASDIEISIEEDSSVVLRGTVDSRETKRAAEDCVDRVSGVEDVRNELRVRRESNLGNEGRTASLS